VVFWSRPLACSYPKPQLKFGELKTVKERIDVMSQFMEPGPVFCGSHNEWSKPQRMLPVTRFADIINRQKPEYFEYLKHKGMVKTTQERYTLLSE